MEKSDRLGGKRLRTSGISIDLGQQTTDNLGERYMPHTVSGYPDNQVEKTY